MKKILIVDDTPSNIDLLIEILGQEYDLFVASDGESAIEIAAEEEVDLILMDIMMPRMDGYTTCRRIKSTLRHTDTPVIFITARMDEESMERAYEAGGVDYISKPFMKRELTLRIETHLRLSEYRKELEFLASRDPLSKLYNRRYFFRLAEEIFDRSAGESRSISISILDLDRFKEINDRYGHDAGDAVICETARILEESAGDDALVGRYGGEEFLVLIPDCDRRCIVDRVSAILEKVRRSSIEYGGERIAFTISAGTATSDSRQIRKPDSLISVADRALYRAKKEGRDRVCSDEDI